MLEPDPTHPRNELWSAPLSRPLNTNPVVECTSLVKDASFPPDFSRLPMTRDLNQFRVQALACPHRERQPKG